MSDDNLALEWLSREHAQGRLEVAATARRSEGGAGVEAEARAGLSAVAGGIAAL